MKGLLFDLSEPFLTSGHKLNYENQDSLLFPCLCFMVLCPCSTQIRQVNYKG